MSAVLADSACRTRIAPEKGDSFGLLLVRPRVVKQITVVGSPDLRHMLKSPAGGDSSAASWQISTLRQGSDVWVRLFPPSSNQDSECPHLAE